MGNLPQNQQKTKYEDYLFLNRLDEGRNLMAHKINRKQVVTVEHTFASEEMLNEYVRQNKNNMALQHQFYLGAFDYEVLSQTNICSKQFKIVEYFEYQPHSIKREIETRSRTNKHFTNK